MIMMIMKMGVDNVYQFPLILKGGGSNPSVRPSLRVMYELRITGSTTK